MTSKLPLTLLYLAVLGLSACGSKDAPADASQASSKCATMPASDMNPADLICGLAAEMQNVADAMKPVTDSSTANTAIRKIEKSKARIKALKAKQKTFSGAEEAEFAIKSTRHMASMRTASKDFITEYHRIANEHPQFVLSLSPALKGIDIGG